MSCPISDARMALTDYAVSDASWLELHFRVARDEDKEAEVFVIT
jgi:hypothetical protein